MFSQWNDRISSLETIVSQLQTSVLELKEENTRLKEQIAQIPVREEEPPVEVFMSGLKRVPNRPSWGRGDDERRKFFTENANSEKYYYMEGGDFPYARNRNTLVPLGTFLGFLNYNRFEMPITDNQYSNQGAHSTYSMRFSNAPYNSECGAIFMNEVKPIVYTHEPPAPKKYSTTLL